MMTGKTSEVDVPGLVGFMLRPSEDILTKVETLNFEDEREDSVCIST